MFSNVQRDWRDVPHNLDDLGEDIAPAEFRKVSLPLLFYWQYGSNGFEILVHQKQSQRGPSRIKFVTLDTFPLHAILGDAAFTTDHANVIAWNRAYCLFPRAVFVVFRPLTGGLGKILASYSKQGWRTSDRLTCDRKIETLESDARSSSGTSFGTGRRLGDCNTWTIMFDNQGVKDPGMPSSVLESFGFRIQWRGEYNGNRSNGYSILQQAEMIVVPVRCCTLRYGYTASDIDWIRFLWRALHKFVTLESWKAGDIDLLDKVDEWEEGTQFECPMLRDHVHTPITWEQVDHLLPRLHREYEVWQQGEFKRIVDEARRERMNRAT